MPLCACSSRPCRVPTAPVNAPRDVAEELRLEQRFRNRAAVDRDEPVGAARAAVVDGARGELLARAGLAGDEDRARRGGDGLEQLDEIAHHAAAADEPVDTVALLELRSQVRVLGSQPALLERGVEHVQQRVELERLGDEVGRALLDRVDRVLHRAEAGDDDRDDFRIALERGLEHGAAVDAGQPEVGDDDVEGELGQARERVFAAGGLLDDEAVVGQPLRDRLPQRRLVVYEKQMFRVFSHLVVRRYFDTRVGRGSTKLTRAGARPTGRARDHFR